MIQHAHLNADDDLCTCQLYDIDGEASNWREQLRAIACAGVEDDEPSDVEISSEDDEPEPEKSSISTHKEAK